MVGEDVVGDSERQELLIAGNYLPPAAYQAIYHKVTAKVEKLYETYYDAYEISFADLKQLYNLLEQTVTQYNVQNKSWEVLVTLHRGEGYAFSSFSQAERFAFSSRCPTSIASMAFDFYVILPAPVPQVKDIVQRFKVSVTLDQDFTEEFFADARVTASRPMAFGENINTVIEYSDYSVARSLQSSVQEWVKGLRTSEPWPLARWANRQAEMLSITIPRLLGISTLLGAFFAVAPRMVSTPLAATQMMLVILIAAGVFYVTGILLVTSVLRVLHITKPHTFLLITPGDHERKKMYQKRQVRRKAVAVFMLASIVVAFGVNLLSSVIYDKLL